MNKPLPKVIVDVDGVALPVDDYSFTSVADGGYHEFRARAPARRLLAVDASQEAPLTCWHEETGDVLWAGRFVNDPQIEDGIGLVSAAGAKAELEKFHGRVLCQSRNPQAWTQGTSPPHNIAQNNSHRMRVEPRAGDLLFSVTHGEVVALDDVNVLAFWAPGTVGGLTRLAFDWAGSVNAGGVFEVRIIRGSGPSGALTTVASVGFSGTSGSVDQFLGANEDMVLVQFRALGNFTITPTYNAVLYNIRVNGLFPAGDTLYAHELFTEVGRQHGYDVTKVASSGMNVLPLDWEGSRAELFTYIASLVDWHWKVSTRAVPGSGLVQYLEAGPWERQWILFKGSGARPNLAPKQRLNEAVVSYRDISGADRQVRVRSDPDPLAKWSVTRSVEGRLADVEPDDTLPLAVGAVMAQRHSQLRWSGDINAAAARDDAGRGDPRLIKPGDLGELADWGPSLGTLHRIHGTEQTPTSVRLAVEAPISAAPLIDVAALERARQPGVPALPELPTEAEVIEILTGGLSPAIDRDAGLRPPPKPAAPTKPPKRFS